MSEDVRLDPVKGWGFIRVRPDGKATVVANKALLEAIASWVVAAISDIQDAEIAELDTELLIVHSDDEKAYGLLDDAIAERTVKGGTPS